VTPPDGITFSKKNMHRLVLLTFLVEQVAGHGSVITPAPRQAHGQRYDSANQCGCQDRPGGCYSNATSPGDYCGIGCVGEACLYYQIGCFQSCETCSLKGKTLYPVPADLVAAGNCPVPPTPTLGGGDPVLEKELRTYNIDNSSRLGDWTRWMPWRSPGTAGAGNPNFSPCGINSGASADQPLPFSKGQPRGGSGSNLPPTPMAQRPSWKAGSEQMVEFSIYANHGGGYSYRLCKDDGNPMTEDCYQKMPLDFATDMSTVHYWDGSKDDIKIQAVSTKIGTFPKGSMWRKNPVPMCNCDIGTKCANYDSEASDAEKKVEEAKEMNRRMIADFTSGGKTCKAVPKGQCGTSAGKNTCELCAPGAGYDCLVCCPGTTKTKAGPYTYCKPGSSTKCDPSDSSTYRTCYGIPYNETYLKPNQKLEECTTGVQYPTLFDDGAGAGIGGRFNWSIQDMVQIPADLEPGAYSLSWRWDCEETPQVWNSCSDIIIAA